MNKMIAVGVGAVLLVLLVLFSTTFTVKYNEVAIKATFGQTGDGSVISDPGLHFRLPVFIDKVTKLDTRLQLVESPLEEITTDDGLQVVVRAFLLWKVDEDDALEFFKSYQTVDGAMLALRGQFRAVFTGVLSRYQFGELLGEESRLAAAEADVREALVDAFVEKGVEPVSVGISQLVLPPKTSSAVLARMQATRDILAQAERNAGASEAEGIRSAASTVADKIRAFADQRAEEIRAQGEQDAAQYMEQMGEDEDLAIFLVWLDTLERTLNRNSTLIVPSRFAPFHLMDPRGVVFRDGIPMPGGDVQTAEPAGAPGPAEGVAP